jgi:GTP cyclohydrolase II
MTSSRSTAARPSENIARRVHVECATAANWREFRRLLTIGVRPIGRFDPDGSVVVLREDKFADLLTACEARVLGAAQCDDCEECRAPSDAAGED